MSDVPVQGLVADLFRHAYGRLVAVLTRRFGVAALAAAEDCVQDALLQALRRWPFGGVPREPEAWLLQVAHRRMLDVVRAARRRPNVADPEAVLATATANADGATAADDVLRLVFLCCHPDLPQDVHVALTLKTVCGFSVDEIARALLARPTAIAQRLVRGKERLRRPGTSFDLPPERELVARLDSVLAVVYLTFNEGYAANDGDAVVRHDLVREAVRLGELLLAAPPTALPKTHALVALMLLQASRLPARVDAAGDLTTLAEQDRTLWDARLIVRGLRHMRASAAGDERTPYHVEAAIASVHAVAPSYAATDWPRILHRYDELVRLADSPLVRLNRAVAVAKVHGVAAGLAAVAEIAGDAALERSHLLAATEGLLRWAGGEHELAVAAFDAALRCRATEPERALLLRRRDAARARQPAPGSW